MSDAQPPQPADNTPARRPRLVPDGLPVAAFAVGLVVTPWAWYAGIPAMYIAGCMLAAAGIGLLVTARLGPNRNRVRAVAVAAFAVLLTVAATFVPGWRPSVAAEQATVWRVDLAAEGSLVTVPGGDTLWLFDESTVLALGTRTGVVHARIELSTVFDVRRTSWGAAVRYEDSHGTEWVAGYRSDGRQVWRYAASRTEALDIRAVRGGVTAVARCRDNACSATGIAPSGKHLWTRRISEDSPSTTQVDGVRVLLSKQNGRWHFIDPRSGHDLATPAPANQVRPWVTGNLAVFVRPGDGETCHILTYRSGTRAWQDTLSGSACRADPEAIRGAGAYYKRNARQGEDHSYIVDARAQEADVLPDFPGDEFGYRDGILTSVTSEDETDAIHGTELATGDRAWSRTFDDAYAQLGGLGPTAVFRDEAHPVGGDDYRPDATIVSLYAAETGRRVATTRLPEGTPSVDGTLGLSSRAVLLHYDHHLTYVGPAG